MVNIQREGLVSSARPKESCVVSPERLQEWRKAPERLNEAEKDALQRAIQAAHQKDLEEMEKDQEVDESMLVEGEEESQERGS
jgi:DNA-binding GntR family transcriptional regulator